MLSVRVRSRAGNWVIAVLGTIYALCATALLIDYVVSTWNGRGLIDYVFQLALVGCIFGGLLFLRISVDNLKGD